MPIHGSVHSVIMQAVAHTVVLVNGGAVSQEVVACYDKIPKIFALCHVYHRLIIISSF